MTTIKLCLGSLALFALHAIIICTPALAQEPTRAPAVVMPPLRVTPTLRCYERPLIQGSGSVRICERREGTVR